MTTTKKRPSPFESRAQKGIKITFPIRVRPATEHEKDDVAKRIVEAYQNIDQNEVFDFMPETFVVIENAVTGEQLGASGLHTPSKGCPQPFTTAMFFGAEGLARTDMYLQMKSGYTYEPIHLAIFPKYRKSGFLTALLIIGMFLYAKSIGGEFILGTNGKQLYRYLRFTLGLPVIIPNLPQVGWPIGSPNTTYWEKGEPAPVIIPLEEATFTQMWRALNDMGAKNNVTFDFPGCPDPLLAPFFQ